MTGFLVDTNVISETVKPRPEGRILPFDKDAAAIWGEIMGEGDRTGRPRPAVDAQIAAIARRRDLTLVTRNLRDFKEMDVTLLDPWAW